jgi:hypothetical protein
VQPDIDDLAARMATAIYDVASFQRLLPDSKALKQKFSVENMAARLEAEYFAALGR